MGRGMYLGVDSKARKVKKMYIGVDGKARKVKKIFVGDANGKARLCWSGFTPMFVGTTKKELITSVDGVSWSVSPAPWDTSDWYSSYGDNQNIGMTYGLGYYWIACGKYLLRSEDAVNWTVVKTSHLFSSFQHLGFMRVFFVNGKIVAYEAFSNLSSVPTEYNGKRIFHVTEDGVNWTSFNDSPRYSANSSKCMRYISDLVYGTYEGEKVYLWLEYGEGANSSSSGYASRIYKSTSLTTDGWTLVSDNVSYSTESSSYTHGQMALKDGTIYVTGRYGSMLRLVRMGTISNYMTDSSNIDYRYQGLASTEDEVLVYRYTKGFQKIDYIGAATYYSADLGYNDRLRYMHPPYNEEGMIAFPIASSKTVNAWYKRKGATAFTKVSSIGTVENQANTVAVYGIDGGGFYTN